MQSTIYTLLIWFLFWLMYFLHLFYGWDLKSTIYRSDFIYDSIMSSTWWTEFNSTNCGSWKIFTINWMYKDKVNVKFFVPQVNTLSGITDYDTYISSVDINLCNTDLQANEVKYENLTTWWMYLSWSTFNIFLWKNTIKDDWSISY